MKTSILFIPVLALLLFSFSKEQRHPYAVEIWYESNLTPGVKYLLNQNEIKVFTSSDFRWRSSKLVYSSKIAARQSDSIYKCLLSLRLDTLRAGYENNLVYDGLYTHYTIHVKGLKRIGTTTYSTSTIATDSLVEIIKSRLLPDDFYPMKLL